jgi:hypothetical protein
VIAADPSGVDGVIELAKSASQLSGGAFLILAGIGLWRKWWVPGWLWRDERDERIKAQADRDKLSQSVLTEVIPLSVRQQDLLAKIEERTLSAMQDRERGP